MLSRRDLLSGVSAVLCTPFLSNAALATETPALQIPAGVTQGGPTTITRIPTEQPRVAMTFDDGPHHSLTPQLLDMLAARNIKATFYLIGRRVQLYPQLTARIAAEGHEIGNHTWNHPRLTSLGQTSLLRELDRTSDIIYETVGRRPVTMRPPYGLLHHNQRMHIHATRNYPTILWSVDPEDWRRPGSSVVANRIVGRAHSGAVILAHDIIGSTVRAMPAALDGLIARGYAFNTVSEIMGWPHWGEPPRQEVAARPVWQDRS